MYRIGIDLGGTNIAVGVVNEKYEIVAMHSVPTGASRPAAEVIRDMGDAVEAALVKAGVSIDQCQSIGVGSPGTCNSEKGTVARAYNLGWFDVPICAKLQSRFGIPVRLSNDANCAALAETVAGAELGHMLLVLDGEECTCGRRGCWETYASATALIRQTKEAMQTNPDSKLWSVTDSLDTVNAKTPFDAAELGDEVASNVLAQFEEYLACGIGGIVNLVRPQVIIIGGGVSAQGEVLLVPLREKLKKYCYASEFIPMPLVVKASLGNDAGIIGAALLGLEG